MWDATTWKLSNNKRCHLKLLKLNFSHNTNFCWHTIEFFRIKIKLISPDEMMTVFNIAQLQLSELIWLYLYFAEGWNRGGTSALELVSQNIFTPIANFMLFKFLFKDNCLQIRTTWRYSPFNCTLYLKDLYVRKTIRNINQYKFKRRIWISFNVCNILSA